MSERRGNLTLLEQPTAKTSENKTIRNRKEELGPFKPRIAMYSLRGARDASSYHEAYGSEIVAGRILRDYDITPKMHDAQAELYKDGKIDTDRIVAEMCDFVDGSKDAEKSVIAFTAAIFSWNHLQSILIKYKQQANERKITEKPTFVVGGSWATFVPPELIHNQFPDLVIVKGAGEEVFSDIVGMVSRGEAVPTVITAKAPDLENYSLPYRAFTEETKENGGHIKIRFSEGCEFGACKFCSRHIKPKEEGDYGVIPAESVVNEAKDLLKNYDVNGFQLTDEDAFAGDIESTRRLISAWKSADLPRMPFFASMRVEEILKLQKADEKLLPQLREIGFQGVFLGVEGGSDDYLRQIGKGQTMKQVREAVNIVNESIYTDPETGEEESLGMEMGMITISPFMTWNMFVDNVRFLSEIEGQTIDENDDYLEESDDITQTYAKYVSALYNPEEVRAGTQNEKKLIGGKTKGGLPLLSYSDRAKDPTRRDHDKYQMFRDYDPEKNFNVNTLAYENVPYVDPGVQAFKEEADQFFDADASLYYAVKSINRAHSLEEQQHEQARDFFLNMKQLHLQYLRNAAGLADFENIPERRSTLIKKMQKVFGSEEIGDALDPVRREIKAFLLQEEERQEAREMEEQTGVLLLCTDNKGRVLLVRPREQEQWAFPGGNGKKGENRKMTAIREGQEELGVEGIKMLGSLGTITKEDHIDRTTGKRPKLTLHHYFGQLEGTIDLKKADHEIVDTIYLSAKEILEGAVETRQNVRQLLQGIIDQERMKNREQRKTSREQVIFQN